MPSAHISSDEIRRRLSAGADTPAAWHPPESTDGMTVLQVPYAEQHLSRGARCGLKVPAVADKVCHLPARAARHVRRSLERGNPIVTVVPVAADVRDINVPLPGRCRAILPCDRVAVLLGDSIIAVTAADMTFRPLTGPDDTPLITGDAVTVSEPRTIHVQGAPVPVTLGA